jgi:O-antigen/teichoic acid export membrane protein
MMLTPADVTKSSPRAQAPLRIADLDDHPGPRPHSLKRNFSWTFLGNVFYTVCQWGMLMLLTKLGTPEMVGQFVLGLAITSPAMSFANLKARGIQASDAKREFRFCEYLGFTLVMTALGLMLITGSTLVGGYNVETALVILAVALGKAFDVICDVFFGLFQQNEHMDRIAKPLMINGLLSMAALGGGVYLTGSVVWGALGWAAAKGLVLALCALGSGSYVSEVERRTPAHASRDKTLMPSFAWPRLLKLTWLTLPLCIAALLLQLNANIPRYFIEHYLGERELGFFAAMAYLMLPGNMVLVAALGQAATPRLAKYFAAGETRAFLMLLLRMAGLVAVGGGLAVLVILLAGKMILTLLYTVEYTQHLDVLFWVTIEAALGFVCSVLAYAMTAARQFRAQVPLSGITVVLSIIACALLISRYGLPGAAFAMVLATTFQLIGSLVIVVLAIRERKQESAARPAKTIVGACCLP